MVDYNSSTLGFTGQDTRHGLVGYSPGTLDNRCARYSIVPSYEQKLEICSYHGKVLKVFFSNLQTTENVLSDTIW